MKHEGKSKMDYTGLIVPILALVDGLLFGLAIKKGVMSFILLLIAFVISGYIGLSFVPNIPVASLWNKVVSYITTNAQSLSTIIPIGNIGSISLIFVLFILGLAVGIWKG